VICSSHFRLALRQLAFIRSVLYSRELTEESKELNRLYKIYRYTEQPQPDESELKEFEEEEEEKENQGNPSAEQFRQEKLEAFQVCFFHFSVLHFPFHLSRPLSVLVLSGGYCPPVSPLEVYARKLLSIVNPAHLAGLALHPDG
jgi:hypothetical protein